MRRAKQNSQAKIYETILALVDKHGWKKLTLEHVAKSSGVSLTQLRALFPEKKNILPALVLWIDECSQKNPNSKSSSASVHDNLFEIIMGRFDILQKYRGSITALFNECRNDPMLLGLLVPAHLRSMQKILHFVEIKTTRLPSRLIELALLGVYYRTFMEWQADMTNDMARTMARLDSSLRWAGRAAQLFSQE